MTRPAHRMAIDRARFRDIVRGKLREDLRKYLSSSELIGRQAGRMISIPVPQIELPRLRFGSAEDGPGQGGAGGGNPGSGDGPGQAAGPGGSGDQPGAHALEVEVEIDELAELLGSELGLPRIEPRGRKQLLVEGGRYTGVRPEGPGSLRLFRRTFRKALERTVSTGEWNPDDPMVVPIPADERFRAKRSHPKPQSAAVLIHMMDVSGSMGREQKDMVRIQAFWIDTWLRSQYESIDVVYIVHDAEAKEVDQETFFRLRESGGTKISSAYALCRDLIRERYPAAHYNIYPFHYSDGDNWSARDTKECTRMLESEILPMVNQFAYSQVKSVYGSGQFKLDLDAHFGMHDVLVTAAVEDRSGVAGAIQKFLQRGR
ncbi:MAG: DUF444 family protein [Planctomycetota bacterium]